MARTTPGRSWDHPAMRAVEAALDAALSEVRRQGGADYLLREARTDGLNAGSRALGRPVVTADGRVVPTAESGLVERVQALEALLGDVDAAFDDARRARAPHNARLHARVKRLLGRSRT